MSNRTETTTPDRTIVLVACANELEDTALLDWDELPTDERDFIVGGAVEFVAAGESVADAARLAVETFLEG